MRILAERMADASGEKKRVALLVRDGKVVSVESWNDAARSDPTDVDCRDALLLPGFIDIHVHGGVGRAVMEGTAEALGAIAASWLYECIRGGEHHAQGAPNDLAVALDEIETGARGVPL